MHDHAYDQVVLVGRQRSDQAGGPVRTQQYAYGAPGQLTAAAGPRWVGSSGTDGSERLFAYVNNGTAVQSVTSYGIVNFAPNDGTNTLLNTNAPSGVESYLTQSYTYNSASSSTTISDTNQHQSTITYNGAGEPTAVSQTESLSGAVYSGSITWSSDNMPVETVSELDDEQNYVRFQKTPKMSSYLLFLAVGEERHRGICLAEHLARVDLPHDGEL